MTKHVISPKKSYVIKKPKSARKILQNKFKPIKNIKLQNIFTKNPKKSRLGTSPA
jgi:histone H1